MTDNLKQLREVLEISSKYVCSLTCPSVKYNNNPWPHSEECKKVAAAIAALDAPSQPAPPDLRDAAEEIDECFQTNVIQSYGTRGSKARDALRLALVGTGAQPAGGDLETAFHCGFYDGEKFAETGHDAPDRDRAWEIYRATTEKGPTP